MEKPVQVVQVEKRPRPNTNFPFLQSWALKPHVTVRELARGEIRKSPYKLLEGNTHSSSQPWLYIMKCWCWAPTPRNSGWSRMWPGHGGFFSFLLFLLLFLFLFFLGPHLWHMEVPRLKVESELQLPAYTAAAAMQDPSLICDLHHSSWQHCILNPLSKARDQTHILMVTSWV